MSIGTSKTVVASAWQGRIEVISTHILEALSAAAKTRNIPFQVSADSQARFTNLATMQTAAQDEVVLQQNAIANRLCFLVSGKAQLFKQRRTTSTLLGTVTGHLVPLGVSGLNSPGRYLSEIKLAEGSEYITLDLDALRDLFMIDPPFAAQFYSLVLAQATKLLWATRGLPEAPPAEHPSCDEGAGHGSDFDVARRLADAPFFSPLSVERIAQLLSYSEMKLFSAGQRIAVEGAPSDGVKILFSGRVAAAYTDARKGGPKERVRTVVRPGVALSWHNGHSDMAAPYTVTATRDTTMLVLSPENIQRLISEAPTLAATLFQSQIWQLGRYQQTAAGLSFTATDDEAAHIEALLQDNSARIPVESVLHGVPHALRNRFTVGHALDSVYDAIVTGNDAERSVAGLMMDVLDGVEREHRFFKGLNAVYTRVTSAARATNPVTLRELSNADFSRAFDQVAYAIKGMEHLPQTASNIYFYNHLAACPENELANGHAFSVDSHFVSSKILTPKYGDGGQRIVRASRNTEFWRNGYYARLDNIFVSNAESDWIDETPEEKERRKAQLFIEAQRTFDAGRPLAIAPEGTSETPDNLTPTSPGPFKPGAFLLAAQLKPTPYLVPIALANFDYSVAQTTYAAVIKPPFLISDHVKDVNDRNEMGDFLAWYREIFRGYVAEARELAEEVNARAATPPEGVITNVGLVSPVEQEFEADVRELEFRLARRKHPGRVALYGSSTFRLWSDAARDLGQSDLVNLGFGGATLTACRSYFKRLVLPHDPSALVFYAGDNDIGTGASGEEVAAAFELFRAEVQEHLPQAKCYVVSIKPSPFRAHLQPQIQQANALIKAGVADDPNWTFIDFHTPMLDADGAPSGMFYGADPLHVNATGYGLLAKLIRDALA